MYCGKGIFSYFVPGEVGVLFQQIIMRSGKEVLVL